MGTESFGKVEPRCEGCGYSLVGLDREGVEKCPECGGGIDWARVEAGVKRGRRPVLGPVLLAVGPFVVCISAAVLASDPFLIGALLLLAWAAAIPFTIGAVRLRGAFPDTVRGRTLAVLAGVALATGLAALSLAVVIAAGMVRGA